MLWHVREICEREPCGDVWQVVGDIQRGESHLPPMGARLCCRPEDVIACCAFGLSDASWRRSSLREEYDTGVADDHRMVSSDGIFAGVIPEQTWGVSSSCSVFFGQDWRCCGYEHFKGKLLSFICVRVRKNLNMRRLGRMKEQRKERTNGITKGHTNEGEREDEQTQQRDNTDW